MNKIVNFSAGPAMMLPSVVEQIKADLPDYEDCGYSIMEHSHRSSRFADIVNESEENFLKLAGLKSADYQVLFMSGGASMQYALLPENFALCQDAPVSYLDSGSWSGKAITEAERVVGTEQVFRIPSTEENLAVELSADQAYLHIVTNETISGYQYHEDLRSSAPLVADMSSDIFSVQRDYSTYAGFYAGAQKNLGLAGITLVCLRKDFLEQAADDLPLMFSYKNFAKSGSLYNTPPCFNWYALNLTLREYLRIGLKEIIDRNRRKAGLLYKRIDSSDFYTSKIPVLRRSVTNVTFNLSNADLEEKFIEEAAGQGLVNLKGHRSTGGVRASIYNAMPEESVIKLVKFMDQFADEN